MSMLIEAYRLFNGGKAPSASFVAIIGALAALGVAGGYITQVAEQAAVDRVSAMRLLRKMVVLGIAHQWNEEGDVSELKRGLRVYYALTDDGHELVKQIMTGVAR